MKSKFDPFLMFLGSLSAIILISLLAYLFFNTQEIKHTAARLERTHEVLHLSDGVLLDILDIETAARGLVQTRKPAFQRSLDHAWNSLDLTMVRLKELAEEPAQGLRIDTLDQVVKERLALTRAMLDGQPGYERDAFEERLAFGPGHGLSERIRSLLTKISAAEFVLLDEGHSQNASTNLFSRLILSALVLSVVLIFFLVMYSLRKLRLHNKALETNAAALALQSHYALGLIEASLDPLIVISPAGRIIDTNQAMAHLTGLTRTALIGLDFKAFFTDPFKATEVYEEVFERGFVSNYPLTVLDAKRTHVTFNGSVYRDDKGAVVGAVIVAHDLTRQNRVEKELNDAILSAELATEIAEEAKQNAENATRTAEQAVKAKQQFLSNMSHEIRTPMNAIIGFTKVMLKTPLTSKQREYISAIQLSGDSLIVLINDILDLAKVDAGKMVFEAKPFQIADSLSAMLQLFGPRIEEKNLRLVKQYDTRIPEVLVGDPARLNQIILNLVSNAVKFTQTGTITVAVDLLEESPTQATVRFAVTDTGIGISENELGSIFENFEQASSSTAHIFGGTGLGLAIVKQLVEQQGGMVEVVSTLNVGSTFTIILSFLKTDILPPKAAKIPALQAQHRSVKVLVVEDIALNQLLMKTLLDDFGFEQDIVANGRQAIAQLAIQPYDIILMDLQMPEMNGFEATTYIRNQLRLDIPIIALTADVTTADLAKCTAVGMNDYIAKPVDERLLYSKILALVLPDSATTPLPVEAHSSEVGDGPTQARCTDLAYLMTRTKSNPTLMKEMIRLYLQQTPPLVERMKVCLMRFDWPSLQAAVHKLIPSFAIVGIHPDYESIAKRVQEYASIQAQSDEMPTLVLQLEQVCLKACAELETEFHKFNTTTP